MATPACLRRRLLLASGMGLGLGLAGPAQAQASATEPLVIAIELKPEGATLYAQEVLRRAYAREGIPLRFEEIPLARSLAMSNEGQLDGEAYRIEGLEASHPNLVPVPYAFSQLQLRVYARKGMPAVQSVEDLRTQRVAITRGVLFTERLLAGHPNLLRSASTQESRRFLARDMADYAVAMELPAAEPVQDEPGVVRQPVVLARAALYHYLHKRHAALVPRLTAQLKQLEARGELAQLRRELIKN